MNFKALLLAPVAVLTLLGCTQASGKDAFGDKVRAYLMAHPEVIEEAMQKSQALKEAKAEEATRGVILKRRADLESDPRDFVANPQGKVTVVEFFDYRCPYCKAALPALMDLIAKNKDIRFVFKEFPILPDGDGKLGVSKRAALAAVAAQSQGKYLDLHNALMSAKPLDDAGIVRALQAANIPEGKALADTPATDKRLEDTRNLATAIGVTGTPSFVVGSKMIPGADMDALSKAIDDERKAKG